jgi:hypothetical protein
LHSGHTPRSSSADESSLRTQPSQRFPPLAPARRAASFLSRSLSPRPSTPGRKFYWFSPRNKHNTERRQLSFGCRVCVTGKQAGARWCESTIKFTIPKQASLSLIAIYELHILRPPAKVAAFLSLQLWSIRFSFASSSSAAEAKRPLFCYRALFSQRAATAAAAAGVIYGSAAYTIYFLINGER